MAPKNKNCGSFTAEITLPVDAKGLLTPDHGGRSKVKITAKGQSTIVKVESEDISSFRAAINSALRDLTVIESTSKATQSHRKI